MSKPKRMQHGPFTWRRQEDQRECEVWLLLLPEEVRMTHFVLKNYGGTPGCGFNGWKLVSGGPFDAAGSYSTRKKAVEGVTPFLVEYYRVQAAEMVENARKVVKLTKKFLGGLDLPEGGD